MNGNTIKILAGIIISILLGLGSWNLYATVDLKTKIPEEYVCKEDYNEDMHRFDNKLDRMNDKLDYIITNGGLHNDNN